MFKLLTNPYSQNPKIAKGLKSGIMGFILHLAPADLSGNEVCPSRSPGCTSLCLNLTGHGRFDKIQAARIRRTRFFFEARESFLATLHEEVGRAVRFAEKRGFAVSFRLNGTSDIPFHRLAFGDHASIMHAFPGVQFYDYTKVAKRLLRETLPANYHLTFSLTEANHNDARAVLAAGKNVAVVFRDKATVARMIAAYPGLVISGDEDDIRYNDPQGVVVALYLKGTKGRNDKSGFVYDAMPDILPTLGSVAA